MEGLDNAQWRVGARHRCNDSGSTDPPSQAVNVGQLQVVCGSPRSRETGSFVLESASRIFSIIRTPPPCRLCVRFLAESRLLGAISR